MIYFAQWGDKIRIGFTNRPLKRRLVEHGSILLGWHLGMRSEERRLHHKFSKHRIGKSDAFNDAPEIRRYIRNFAFRRGDMKSEPRDTIIIRVPPETKRIARRAAKVVGLTLTDYIIRLIHAIGPNPKK